MAPPLRPTAYERRPPAAHVVDRALAASRQAVFWLEDAPAFAGSGPLTEPVRADLTVVGGGYLGLWTAVLAKRREPGARVVLLEAESVGWAASGRNGGFCEASLTHGEANGRRRWAEEYDDLERLGTANLDAMQCDVRELGIDCHWERTGMLSVAVEDHQVEWLGSGPDVLTAEEARQEVNSPILLGATWEQDSTALV